MIRFIYILTENGIPVYVGKTKNPKQREAAHKSKFPTEIFEIIDEVPTAEWKFWERHYISLYKSWGFDLRNKKLHAGNGCDVMSDEQKELIGIASKKMWSDPIFRKKMLNTGFHTLESRKKSGKTRKGKSTGKKSVEFRLLLSKIRRDKNIDKGEKNSMYGTHCYNIWIEKYGVEEAEKRRKIQIEKCKQTKEKNKKT
jgi:hypothetical protein